MPEHEQQNLNTTEKIDAVALGPNQPIFKERINRIDIAVWKNERGFSISLQKSYKRKDSDEWTRMKISFFPDEVDSVIAVMTKVKEFLQKEGVKTFRVEKD